MRSLLARYREAIFDTVGSETRQIWTLHQQLEALRWHLQLDVINICFAECLAPADPLNEIKVMNEELYTRKAQGLIRYIGVKVSLPDWMSCD